MEYKYLVISEIPPEPLFARDRNRPYSVKNKKGQLLGLISFYPDWNKYIFEPAANIIFDQSCLRDIIDFLVNHAGKPLDNRIEKR